LKWKLTNRRMLYILLLCYSIAIGIYYAFPTGLTAEEWHSFYSYLDGHGATPYVDVREGYPPIGFLIYMPLYYAFQDNVAMFSCGFRALNGALLVATLFALYHVSKSVGGEREGLKTALCYALLPSVVMVNAYSNDVVALLPAVLAIYMMQKRRAALCGLLLGLATLSKGFPALLLIPALIAFTDAKDKVKLVGFMVFTVVFVSLPFMIANPFTYMSTFTHHGSRGPWETVWALAEGYYSHGGLLHPYSDKFFYHFNLLSVYPASHYDHAIYQWSFNILPDLLTVCQIGVVALLAVAHEKLKGKTVALCGLLYIGYMLFFKGYSTQFSVSTSLYLLLATMNNPVKFLVPLELSHILQRMSWDTHFFGSEALRDVHLPMLVFAVVLRSIVFGALIFSALRSNFRFKQLTDLVKRLAGYFRLLKDKWLVLAVSATVVMALMSSVTLSGYLGDDARFRSSDGCLNVTVSDWQSINVDGLKKGDQIMVRLVTNTWIDAEMVPDDLAAPIERGVRNPYNLKDSFNETILFFAAESESYRLMLKMAHPAIPFRVTDGLDGDLDVNATVNGSALVLELRDEGADGRGSMLRLAYPCGAYVGNDFSLSFKYEVTEGTVSDVLLDVFDDTDEWIYSFDAAENFVLKPDSRDICGCSNMPNDQLSLVAISTLLDDNSSATIRLEELAVNSGNGTCEVNFYAGDSEEVPYEIFVERDFTPSTSYGAALILTVAFAVAALYRLHAIIKGGKQAHDP
jgi:4-amino-4-deoxy-L-arabinose transferase-like glycosyltransferase